jgi:hypothetical protein
VLLEKDEVGLTSGLLFLKKHWTPANETYFEEALVERLEWIHQNTTGIIHLAINSWEEFGVITSMRRGATTTVPSWGIDGIASPTIDDNKG